jgi:hypothetical protein
LKTEIDVSRFLVVIPAQAGIQFNKQKPVV